jgi:hypothetical protein
MKWPPDLAELVGRVYEEWRIHISDPLDLQHPQEASTQEFLRYYLIGNESIIGRLMREHQAVFCCGPQGFETFFPISKEATFFYFKDRFVSHFSNRHLKSKLPVPVLVLFSQKYLYAYRGTLPIVFTCFLKLTSVLVQKSLFFLYNVSGSVLFGL